MHKLILIKYDEYIFTFIRFMKLCNEILDRLFTFLYLLYTRENIESRCIRHSLGIDGIQTKVFIWLLNAAIFPNVG